MGNEIVVLLHMGFYSAVKKEKVMNFFGKWVICGVFCKQRDPNSEHSTRVLFHVYPTIIFVCMNINRCEWVQTVKAERRPGDGKKRF